MLTRAMPMLQVAALSLFPLGSCTTHARSHVVHPLALLMLRLVPEAHRGRDGAVSWSWSRLKTPPPRSMVLLD